MSSGGARIRSGPAPDPNALRRERKDDAAWLDLPLVCERPVPDWPLVAATERETELWTGLWVRPQAEAWHRFGLADQVAMYVRRFCEAETPGSPVSVGTLVRQLADTLGLSMPGLNSLRWRIPAEAAAPAVSQPASVTDLRSRLAKS